MARVLYILLAAMAVLLLEANGYALQHQSCGPNEIYTTCGTSCEKSCEKPYPDVCSYECYMGCNCLDGYLRNAYNQCVLPYQC